MAELFESECRFPGFANIDNQHSHTTWSLSKDRGTACARQGEAPTTSATDRISEPATDRRHRISVPTVRISEPATDRISPHHSRHTCEF